MVIAIPILIVVSAYVLYAKIVRPRPVALGSQLPKFCIVSSDEICKDCESSKETDEKNIPITWRDRLRQFRIANRHIALMTWNTRLFQQVVRFEQRRIRTLKPSISHDGTETLTLRLAKDAKNVRLLLFRAKFVLMSRLFLGKEIKDLVIQKLQELRREYKHLEDNAVNLFGLAEEFPGAEV